MEKSGYGRDGIYRSLRPPLHLPNNNNLPMWSFDRSNWEEISDLGDEALFVGDNSSVSVDTSLSSTKCQNNCIYFTNDYSVHSNINNPSDMGVYNLVTRSVRRFNIDTNLFTRMGGRAPIWIRNRVRYSGPTLEELAPTSVLEARERDEELASKANMKEKAPVVAGVHSEVTGSELGRLNGDPMVSEEVLLPSSAPSVCMPVVGLVMADNASGKEQLGWDLKGFRVVRQLQYKLRLLNGSGERKIGASVGLDFGDNINKKKSKYSALNTSLGPIIWPILCFDGEAWRINVLSVVNIDMFKIISLNCTV
ncbi:hypothetical protein CsatB_006440 [Cannabis sativa]